MNTKAYASLLALSLVATVGGVLTLIPFSGATYENVLGYRSLCTFAPAATLYCFAIAGASCIVRASFVKRRFQFGKTVFRRRAIVVVAAFLVLGLAATGWFVVVKREYTDGQSAPSVSQSVYPRARRQSISTEPASSSYLESSLATLSFRPLNSFSIGSV